MSMEAEQEAIVHDILEDEYGYRTARSPEMESVEKRLRTLVRRAWAEMKVDQEDVPTLSDGAARQ